MSWATHTTGTLTSRTRAALVEYWHREHLSISSSWCHFDSEKAVTSEADSRSSFFCPCRNMNSIRIKSSRSTFAPSRNARRTNSREATLLCSSRTEAHARRLRRYSDKTCICSPEWRAIECRGGWGVQKMRFLLKEACGKRDLSCVSVRVHFSVHTVCISQIAIALQQCGTALQFYNNNLLNNNKKSAQT